MQEKELGPPSLAHVGLSHPLPPPPPPPVSSLTMHWKPPFLSQHAPPQSGVHLGQHCVCVCTSNHAPPTSLYPLNTSIWYRISTTCSATTRSPAQSRAPQPKDSARQTWVLSRGSAGLGLLLEERRRARVQEHHRKVVGLTTTTRQRQHQPFHAAHQFQRSIPGSACRCLRDSTAACTLWFDRTDSTGTRGRARRWQEERPWQPPARLSSAHFAAACPALWG
eukprot:338432-Rhodomonas_salina.3